MKIGWLRLKTVFTFGAVLLLGCSPLLADDIKLNKAAIASAHPLATAAGFEILAAGGNAFDAAVAVSATLAVVEPYSSGIGGGGFYLLHRSRDGFETLLDAREKAPLAARPDMYLDKKGNVDTQRAREGALAAGIPGIPAALQHLAEHYGALPLNRSLAPAIRYARAGFEVSALYRSLLTHRLKVVQRFPEAAGIFLHQNDLPALGHRIVQPDLAATLHALATQGADGFYRGAVAGKLVQGVRDAGGIWQLQDLHDYRVVERAPLYGAYRGMKIISAPPPSSGGVALIEALNILSHFDVQQLQSLNGVHLTVEAMRRAYRDRAEYLGDPDHVEMPLQRLLHPMYAAGLAVGIRPDKATKSDSLPGVGSSTVGNDTTHFSILDQEGNRVAATLSINFSFGSGFVPPGTGVLLNNEMDDFSAKPNVPNGYGLIGGSANAIAPGKRMLSSMTPTFLETDTRLAIVGTPGGSRIISMVLLASLEFYQGGSAVGMVSLPRIHHQFHPDVLVYESDALNWQQRLELQMRGHKLQEHEAGYGNMHVVVWDKKENQVTAASDPRGEGQARVAAPDPPR